MPDLFLHAYMYIAWTKREGTSTQARMNYDWSPLIRYVRHFLMNQLIWACTRDIGTYHIREERRLRRDCASAQSRQSLRFSHTQSMKVEEDSDQNLDI